MSEVKFTPGPWHFDPRDGDFGDICSVEAVTEDGKMVRQEICTLLVDDDDRETVKATARLIAASPDLYAACERMVRAQGEDVGAVIEAMDMARAALAKATQ